MGRQLLVRLLQTFVSLLGMSLLIFVLVRASGDPVDLMRTATTTDVDMANMRATLGLDKSYPEQYWIFVSGLLRGDLGNSLIQRRPAWRIGCRRSSAASPGPWRRDDARTRRRAPRPR